MNQFRLAAAALNQTPLAWDANRRTILAALAAARDQGVGVLCLPELCITGYGCEDMFFSAGVHQTALELLTELVPESRGLVATFGLPVFYEGAVYNAAALACDGTLLGLVAKQHLAGDGIHYEPRWFRRWPAGNTGMLSLDDENVPIGDLLFDCGGVRIGMEICRDAWVADRTGISLARRGADVILNPSASHFAFAKQQIRERFVLEGSRAFCVSYAYANLLGNEAGRSIYDGGTLVASGGKMLIRGPRFSYADWVLTTALVDVVATRRTRAESFPESSDAGVPAEGQTIVADFDIPDATEPSGTVSAFTGTYCAGAPGSASAFRWPGLAEPAAAASLAHVPGHPAWETGSHQKEEEFTRSVALALFDYLRKSHTQRFVVSLSGGVDSSTVAVLVHLMVQLAGRELGLPALADKLAQVEELQDAMGRGTRRGENGVGSGSSPSDPYCLVYSPTDDLAALPWQEAAPEIVGCLLTCVYQATRNSSEATLQAARTVADAVGAEFIEWNVDAMVDQYVEMISAAVGRQLTWDEDDLALQNIQARARGPGIWLLANLRGALLLTTSNRSEAAVGYATMDGDTCGGLAPIAGIDKAFLRDWLRWMETTGPAGIGPLPALAVVDAQQPTAELRPTAAAQTDEGDLMPYRVLDAIERAAIRDKLLPVDVWKAVCPQFPQYDRRQVGEWVERFFHLWCRNQWKRERYAPSFHLDDENLDPKTWCRFPILNSGFERELEELREVFQKDGIGF